MCGFWCFLVIWNLVTVQTGGKQLRQGQVMIWNAVFWFVWHFRNKIIFDNGTMDFTSLVEDIKIASWKWWISKSEAPNCLWYEWIVEPVLCLKK
jgi:hypothetical protein